MNIFNIIALFGGLAMFLYGMRLMGDSLKESASGTLKAAMEQVTNNPVKAFFLGLFMTALVQSSTATIVITAGLVAAGILTTHQSLGIIIGANVGTTVTGQIIRLLDLDGTGTMWLRFFQPSTLAPIALIVGILLIMGFKNSKSTGNIMMGFGILFTGLMNMTNAVSTLTSSPLMEKLFTGLGSNPILGYLVGAGVAFLLQSSSATIGILQAFSASGVLTFKAIYAVIVGVYLGDCITTGIVISIGAKQDAKRVGAINILYNLAKSILILVIVTIVHRLGLIDGLWNQTATPGLIANTNTIFNLGCAVLLFPFLRVIENLAYRIVKEEPKETLKDNRFEEKLAGLNPAFFNTPALAFRSCYDLLLLTFDAARENINAAISLVKTFDEKKMTEVLEEENTIDLAKDRISTYIVDMMPYVKEENHVSIINQYYKVSSEFENLGDVAEDIAQLAKNMNAANIHFSESAFEEFKVLQDLMDQVLDYTNLAFKKRDINAARHIEPLIEVVDDVIATLKEQHLKRMGEGKCDIYADTNYMNLLSSMRRIAGVCSNVGTATVVRVKPELLDQEHSYYEQLHAVGNTTFNKEYQQARETYFSRLKEVEKKQEEHVETVSA